MDKKLYKTIYADPPWNELGGGKVVRGANRHYRLMKTRDICMLDVSSLCEEDCHLYMWVTNGKLLDGIRVMEEWSFRYVTKIDWVKKSVGGNIQFGLGQYFRGSSESCLFGRRGGMLPYKYDENGKRMQGITAIIAPRTVHSKKPAEMRRMIERVSYGPMLELFATERNEGWDAWGDAVDSDVELHVRG